MTIFDKYLTKILSELSNGTTMNVSLLDMPGFGSKYQGNCNLYLSWINQQLVQVSWANQVNMAFYHKLMSMNNNIWDDKAYEKLRDECNRLFGLWDEYMSNFEENRIIEEFFLSGPFAPLRWWM